MAKQAEKGARGSISDDRDRRGARGHGDRVEVPAGWKNGAREYSRLGHLENFQSPIDPTGAEDIGTEERCRPAQKNRDREYIRLRYLEFF